MPGNVIWCCLDDFQRLNVAILSFDNFHRIYLPNNLKPDRYKRIFNFQNIVKVSHIYTDICRKNYYNICSVAVFLSKGGFSVVMFVGYRNNLSSFFRIRKIPVICQLIFRLRVAPARNYMLKINNGNTRMRCEKCSKLIIKTSGRHLALIWCFYC